MIWRISVAVSRYLSETLHFQDDFREVDKLKVIREIDKNTQFSVSYIILLVTSTIISTLGLLTNSSPVIIGGMIISPLMWPLMKIAVGVSFERKSFVIQATRLLVLSILISLLSAFFITLLSPLKTVSSEIAARTHPTHLDVLIALAAGSIAAFAIIRKKISSSLAGVAIATSLMPPLCVSGIGFALLEYDIALGGFLLFFTNVISMTFISTVIFAIVGIKRRNGQPFLKKELYLVGTVLVMTSLYLLSTYNYRTQSYRRTREVLTSELQEVSLEIAVKNIQVNRNSVSGKEVVLITAEVLVPEELRLTREH